MATIAILNENMKASTNVLSEMLDAHHQVIEFGTVAELMAASNADFDVVIIHEGGSATQSLTALEKIQSSARLAGTPVVIVTAATAGDGVIEAMRLGAFDHLSEPVGSSDLYMVINRALAKPKEVASSSENNAPADHFFAGVSPAMRRVEKLIGIAASCDATVLIEGATGTGKTTVARTIHKHSQHRTLTVIDCTAVPEDYQSFYSLAPGAHGTVILDEIGDLNSQTQALLVRALKESSGEVGQQPRIIATTQYDLIAMVKEKRFREDLYYRLNVMKIALPPLKERGSDILALAETFLHHARPEAPKRLSTAVAKMLLDYAWPGNVRELENLMYHLTFAVRARQIEPGDLHLIIPSNLGADIAANADFGNATDFANADLPLDYYATMGAVERQLLERALAAANGSRAEAARVLGINRQLLYAKLKTHGLMGG